MGMLGAFWGVTGVLLLFAFAVVRLLAAAVDAFSYQVEWYHWLTLALNTPVVAYFKGYVAIHGRFTPRVADRARQLRDQPTIGRVLLAPLYCIGYFHAPRKTQAVTLLITGAMVGLIMLIRLFEQPWRGILDVAIIIALSLGFFSLLYHTARAFGAEQAARIPQTG